MEAEIRSAYPGAQVTLVPSSGGRFEVVCDGTAVYEKSRTGRHPRPGELVALLRARGSRP